MESWLGQYCLNVTDLERSVAFYTALGLTCTSRTEIEQAWEAIVENPAGGSKFQLAQQKEQTEPLDLGTAFWKLYVNTRDVATVFERAVAQGASVDTPPARLDRWPVTVGFVRDPDGYLVELVEREPWPDDSPTNGPWLGQYCINVTDIERSISFFEALGLTCTSRTEIEHAHEAILESPGKGSKVQLAQQLGSDDPVRMGSMWKLYVNTDDCVALHAAALGVGARSVLEPIRLDRWPTTVSFVSAPDDYLVELVQRHTD
ncbi:MAG TPA: VOC family protein [Candidatus Acidoferrum sp.]|nr:VOC family protein [Candidatus Acidoferrum sp.]